MKTIYKILSLAIFSLTVSSANATVWNVNVAGFTFTPSTITINLGDTVNFSLGGSHNAVEVSQATWNANGNTSNGGFTLPFGGGTLIPTQVKTYYYVCSPHASSGMKGQIIVNNSTGLPTVPTAENMLVLSPNPAASSTMIQIGSHSGQANQFSVFDVTGKMVWSEANIRNNHVLDVTRFRKGIYFAEFRAGNYRRTAKLVID